MNRAWRTFFFAILPVATNWLLGFAAFFIRCSDFDGAASLCYLVMASACAAAATSIIGFVIHDIGPTRTMAAIAFQTVGLIFVFAGIYRGYGLMFGGQQQSLLEDGSSALYFSIVTWTTLGYGDFSPPANIRMVAGIEAMLGYIFLGVLVGLVTYHLCTANVAARDDRLT